MAGHTTLPSAVQRQNAVADEALAALEKMRSDEDEAVEASAHVESAVETKANTQDAFDDAVDRKPTPAAEPAKVEEKKGEERTVSLEEFEKLKQKLDVLQGKYNSEVPRYAAKMRDLETQNDSLKDQLDEAKEQKKQAELSAEAYKKYLTEEEAESLDENFAGINSKIARGVSEEVADRRAKQVESRVDELQKVIDQLNQQQAASANERFWAAVERQAPGATVANETDEAGWVEFLDKVDPVSRLSYRDIGTSAIMRQDSEAVANLFNLYKEGMPAPAEAPRKSARSQVKPESTSSVPTTQSQPKGRIIRQSEIERFYQEAAKSGMSQADIAKKEAEFETAANEGRIIFNR